MGTVARRARGNDAYLVQGCVDRFDPTRVFLKNLDSGSKLPALELHISDPDELCLQEPRRRPIEELSAGHTNLHYFIMRGKRPIHLFLSQVSALVDDIERRVHDRE